MISAAVRLLISGASKSAVVKKYGKKIANRALEIFGGGTILGTGAVLKKQSNLQKEEDKRKKREREDKQTGIPKKKSKLTGKEYVYIRPSKDKKFSGHSSYKD